MIATVKSLLATISDKEADELDLLIYDTSGRSYKLVEIYVDDGFLCIDLERDPDSI